MREHAIRIIAPICIVLLLQSGCATVRPRPQAGEARIVAKDLVEATRSWDGKPLSSNGWTRSTYGINEGNVPAEIIVFYAGVVGTPVAVGRPH